jgi:hypothetical protein
MRVSDFDKNLILVVQKWQINGCTESRDFLSLVHRDRTDQYLPTVGLFTNRGVNGTRSPIDTTLAELDTRVLNSLLIYARLLTAHAVILLLSNIYRDRGFDPGRSRRIFRAKKSTAFLPSEGK